MITGQTKEFPCSALYSTRTLGYADDAALVDLGDVAGIIKATATERLSKITTGSFEDDDMQIKIEKTKSSMHIRQQNPIADTIPEEA